MRKYNGPERRKILIQQAQLRADVRPFWVGYFTFLMLAAWVLF